MSCLFKLLLFIHQLAEKHNVRAVISVNEAYELNFFTNSKEVRWMQNNKLRNYLYL